MQNDEFKQLLHDKAHELFRDMPWRADTRPYYVLVSELMLQQTQVVRVIPKFIAFIEHFPDERTLASASLAQVLQAWQGLGYNRRAKFLHDAAKRIVHDFNGLFPTNSADILSLPGVGKNTLGAIQAYAFNRPTIFIETNIRTVYIHHFYDDQYDIDDKQIIDLLEQTIDKRSPREFYWALMDYGSWLKANGVKNVSQSRHYKKQSPLEGSVRQMRGQLLSRLSVQAETHGLLLEECGQDTRFEIALSGLVRDGLVVQTDGTYHLTK